MERERLTITLRRDILKLVDQSIDGARLRNRSHAIEYYLSQQLSLKAAKVVVAITGGGRTLYQAGGMQVGVKAPLNAPDLKNIFAHLSSQNFQEVMLAGTDQQALQTATIDADRFGLNVKTMNLNLDGRTPLEQNIDSLKDYLKDESFVFWDSRFLGEIKLSDLLEFHKNSKATATAAIAQVNGGLSNTATNLAGQLYGNKIVSVDGEDLLRGGGMPLVGIFVFSSSVFDELTANKSLYRDVLPKLAQAGKLNGFAFSLANVTAPVTARR